MDAHRNAAESQADEAATIFRRFHPPAEPVPQPPRQGRSEYDVFISYAHEDDAPVGVLVEYLRNDSLRLFLDRLELSEGSAWQPAILSAIDRCKRLVAVYSPAYVQSKVCQEEFNIAWARGRKLQTDMIFPVYWETADLPTYMDMLLYADCRERQSGNLQDIARRIARACA